MQRNLVRSFPGIIFEYDQVKVLWDFKIQTDLHLDHNKPGIVVLEKKECATSSMWHALSICEC